MIEFSSSNDSDSDDSSLEFQNNAGRLRGLNMLLGDEIMSDTTKASKHRDPKNKPNTGVLI